MAGFTQYCYDEKSGIVVCGAGLKLMYLCKNLHAIGVFVLHGQCAHICVGGHLQSGGVSPYFVHSFSLFYDHIVIFCIIMVNMKTQVVTKKENDNLWMAVMGGSPVNFGVIGLLVLKPLWDSDYPSAHA